MMEIREIQVSKLKNAPYNPRQIDDKALDGLEASITRWGLVEPIIWNEKTGYIVGGHQRLKVLERQKTKKTQVIVVNLDETEEKALNVTLNNRSIQGDWTAQLGSLIEELKGSLSEADYLDLHIKELEAEIPNMDQEIEKPTSDPDDVPDTPADPKSSPGTVYILGRHRVICGDATKAEDYDALFGDKQASMVFTDPPYNVNYEGLDGKKIKNDNMEDEEFRLFLGAAFGLMSDRLLTGSGVYVCHADIYGLIFRLAFVEAGLSLKQCLVWVKNSLVFGRRDYHWKHEPILYGWKPGAAHRWYGGRNKSTVVEDSELLNVEPVDGGYRLHLNNGVESHVIKVPAYEVEESTSDEFTSIWRFEKPARNPDHPTMKPVGIPTRAILNSSQKDDIVLDPFLGSGSTLIACEQTGRSCYGFELDPRYCDVIIKRWEDFTGKKSEVA